MLGNIETYHSSTEFPCTYCDMTAESWNTGTNIGSHLKQQHGKQMSMAMNKHNHREHGVCYVAIAR
jgi:hypothetical protein